MSTQANDLLGIKEIERTAPWIDINFGAISRKWRKQWLKLESEINLLTEESDAAAFARGFELDAQRNTMMAQAVKGMSRDLLIDNAPEVIDWTDPDAFDEYVAAHVNVPLLVWNEVMTASGNLLNGWNTPPME